MRVLITGFSPMQGWKLNASEVVMSSIASNLPMELLGLEQDIRTAVVPAVGDQLEASLRGLLAEHEPTICLFMGQAAARNKIALERFAINWKEQTTADAKGYSASGEKIAADGPAAYCASLPDMPGIAARLSEAGIPAYVSNFAGTSLCNQLLYLALHEEAARPAGRLFGFIHLPVLPEQVETEWRASAFMPLGMQRDAVSLVVQTLHERADWNVEEPRQP